MTQDIFRPYTFDKRKLFVYHLRMDEKNIIKELRLSKGLSQIDAANLVGLSIRTYQNYEYGKSTRDTFKIKEIVRILNDYEQFTETKGILTIDQIKTITKDVFDKYDVKYAYLFGSYSKGTMSESSDVDILISTDEKGMSFVSISEDLHDALHKQIDLINLKDTISNLAFLDEVLKTAIKIYDRD